MPYKILLEEHEMPTQWYNIQADLPNPLKPPLNPQTQKPLTPDDLLAIFPMPLIMQEVSTERWIDIPEEILNVYKLWRPSPVHRAYNLEKALGTPAKIYYKQEGVSPAGSHKPNTAVAQAYYNKISGIKRLATETGAGQWGSALSLACSTFGLECTVYMVKVSYYQKPYRRSLMEVWGANVIPSPSEHTNSGKNVLEKYPDSMGSLGIAISEAVEDAATKEDTNYSLGSVLNHVLLHQTVIGLESKVQLDKVNEYPDVVVACCGGGSNFGGIALPFLYDKINGKDIDVIAVEPSACPTLTRGEFTYDYGDIAKLTPLVMMYTLGHDFVPPGIHAGGLRYHGESPLVSQLVKDKLVEARAVNQLGCFEAALQFTRSEGILPAPETSHAIRTVVDLALECKESGEEKTILFNFSGHGHFDLTAYDDYLAGKLQDYEYPDEEIKKSLKDLPKIDI
ncbi:MAG: TrpB-like pyridoxal phosphate-dependent enzyme [Candidatus Syntrophonatronum acetioxidans]|uniref:Tryptophan synthase beta chain n=1 Tax=Candidatus Syntrophonatronum acetioxidans TaxID=1795816 RepID=A0A424YD36_9FIRM|nr:MAG: TrpB-like pyridoxal phosphate-dependent enzyme [Candidatus Syntrophonatronum acetioxidans]